MKRNRPLYGFWITGTILVGLYIRQAHLPAFISLYLGDVLWALMIFLGIGFLFVGMPTWRTAVLAISFCFFIECSQLYHAPWIDSIRNTTLGGLVLGYGFLWSDLAAYSAGVGFGAAVELAFFRVRQKY